MSELPPATDTAPPRMAVVLERRRQHPLGPLLRLQGMGQALVVGVFAGGSGGGWMRLLSVVPILLLIAVRVVEWARTSYEVADGALRVDSGLLTRRRREVPLDRVQQVDVRRGLRHRLFGLSQVTVDAAGASGGEVSLILSNADTARFRGVLVPVVTRETAAVEAERADGGDGAGPGPLVRLRPGQLALAGVTGAKQLVMLAVLGSALQLLDNVPADVREAVAERLPRGTGWLIAAAVLAVPAWVALAAVAQLATDLGFTLTSDGSVLNVRRGFPTEREASLPLDRVQVVRVGQTLLRRPLGLVSVQVSAAGSGSSAEAQVSRLTVPILPAERLDHLVGAVLAGATPLPPLAAAPPAARRRQVLRRVVPAVAVAGAAAALLWPWGLVAALVVPAAAAAGELAYRGLGHARTGTHMVARRGGLGQRTVVLPVARTQSARVRQTLLQRRAGLATLSLDAAGRGNVAVAIDLPAEEAVRLAEGAATAAAARADERLLRRR
ncbi:MAG: hypothetical protein AVDCRST_MAG76-3755 [uncultured Acidimicrobiales bacterium]|uniref:YdbS-like PH domain-containing protein n=1 Tax=uncultured Acidimicrobiales bacterium TaxID=310071 RepID=A0A6J4JHX2_9ACTN|nr:MAG: hypothetical protein AVDCRST_MAG76-3755 [uncultured Acidimicrobiales bacterium]